MFATHTLSGHDGSAMSCGGTILGRILVVCVVVPGCGAKSDGQGGGSTSPTGGVPSTTTLALVGGAAELGGGSSVLASGGRTPTTVTGGVSSTRPSTVLGGSAANGGTYYGTTGTTRLAGGTSASGGKSATGGKSGVGGVTNAGGKTSTLGTIATGGKSGVGGVTSTGGKTSTVGTAATGGASVGGMSAVGGSPGTGGTTALGTGWLDAGATLNEFCTGDDAKVSFGGKQILAPATSYESSLVMDCCQAYGINLHTKPTLDVDIAIETIWSGATNTITSFPVGTGYEPMRAVARRSTDPASAGTARAQGTGILLTAFSYSNPFDLGLCLQVQPTETPISGMLIYVPRVTLSSFSSQSRFQIFLLSDSTVTTAQAQAQALDTLSLAPNPILDLRKITYLSSSSHELGFNPGQKIGETLKTQIGNSLATPFVVVANDERIFLGTFVSPISSMAYTIPSIMTDSIESDTLQFTIAAGNDPLMDTRITTVLTDLSRMIP